VSHQPHEVIEGVSANLEKSGYPDFKKHWILCALKHILRLGKKDDIVAELQKAENYIHRARTGEWFKEIQPVHYGGELENSDGENGVSSPQSLLSTKSLKAMPPKGIMPRQLFLEQRIEELASVLRRYALEKKAPKEEWIIELNERQTELLSIDN